MSKRKNESSVTQRDIELAAVEAFIARHEGQISPRLLLDDARRQDSPFHQHFEWDDEICGEQYRLIQAGQLIRRWKGTTLRIDEATRTVKIESVRRVQSPENQRKKGGESYETVEQIMRDPAKRAAMLQTVLRELAAYRRRYAQLMALADVWSAIDDAMDAHVRPTQTGNADDARPAA